MPTNKYDTRGRNGGIRKSSFGNDHINNCFSQESSMEAKISGQS